MKIVHAVYSLEMGGAEVLVGQLCRIQRSQGHHVSVVAYAKLGVVGETLKAEGFTVQLLGEAHPLITMKRYFLLLRRIRPDVVHCHNVAPTIQAALSARLAGVRRVVSTRHGMEIHPYDIANEMKYNLMGWFCDWIVGVSDLTCAHMRRGPLARKKRIVCVYNGTSRVDRVVDGNIPKVGFTLVFVGRIARVKDLGTLLHAVALAASRSPRLDCWIVGDGPVRAEMESLARQLGLAERVQFWGQRTDTAGFFSAADAFVMSSISEGLPMSLLQAMSLGIPSVLTDVGGMGEVLRLTGGGLLVPAGDAAAMAEAIVRLAEDKALHAELSRLAHDGYKKGFTLEKMNDRYKALYLN